MQGVYRRLPWRALTTLWQREFRGYNAASLRRDILAGITVGAVALPLALAFGVASGATAAAGMVTAGFRVARCRSACSRRQDALQEPAAPGQGGLTRV